MKTGRVSAAEPVADSAKLLRLEVEFGEDDKRQVVAGVAPYFPNPSDLVGRDYLFVTNIPPRTIMGLESRAMIVALSDGGTLALLTPTAAVPPGTKAS